MAIVLTHLLAVYVIVAEPLLGLSWFRSARQRMQAGDARAKVRLYRTIFMSLSFSTAAIGWLCLSGAISPARLGLGAPRSWWLSAGLAVALGGLLLWSGIRLQPKAAKIREKIMGAAALLLPDTPEERGWLAAISVGAGISEELLFRGFLFYYLGLWFPHINRLECALLTSLIFGMGHLYQGWKGIVSTGIVGMVMAGLYVLTGNLVVPMTVHATTDLRALLIFWHGPERQEAAVEAA